MKTVVSYEWAREYINEHDDILHIDFANNPKDLHTLGQVDGAVATQICLMRNRGNQDDGLQERAYAYPDHDGMPREFDNGCKVLDTHKYQYQYYMASNRPTGLPEVINPA